VTEFRRVALRTGVELNVGLAGPVDAPPAILLHGFPESHRTWRALVPRLGARFRLIMPDLRGFGASDRPKAVKAYRSAAIVEDVLALATAMRVERFFLVGHDLGGVIAWNMAQDHPSQIIRLVIINAPHPFVFQKSLIDHRHQRRASQYIKLFKAPGAARLIARDLDRFFDKVIGSNVERVPVLEADRRQYLAEWSQPGALAAMLNWYRASPVLVPPPPIGVPLPRSTWRLARKIEVPTLVLWGMRDHALLPVQLDGLEHIVEQLSIVRLPEIGHWAPWEAPDEIAQAVEAFLGGAAKARAQAR
jgi:pimeloyl-ACP methyl ester carboxylesterase